MLKPDAKAPPFTLTDDTGRPHSLATLTADGPLVLYFYPADSSPGCTRQACAFRDAHAQLLAAGLTLAGISPQGAISHARFREKHSLPFPLLTDPTKTVIRAYGADGPLGIGVRRVTYLITPERTIAEALRADFKLDLHAKFLRRAIEHASAQAAHAHEEG